MPSTPRVYELFQKLIGRPLRDDEFRAMGGTPGGGVNLSDDDFINRFIKPNPEFQQRVRAITTEAYKFALARDPEPVTSQAWFDFVTAQIIDGIDPNTIFENAARGMFQSEEVSVRGMLAIEREYLDKYERPILLELARKEIEPELREKLADQLRQFQLQREQAQDRFNLLAVGFVAQDAQIQFDPNIPVGELETRRRRLWEDFTTNLDILGREQGIDTRVLQDQLGLAGLGFGGIRQRKETILGEQYGQRREAEATTRTRGFEDLLQQFKDAELEKTQVEQRVGVGEELAQRESAREITATAERLAESRLAEPAAQRRQRLKNILGLTEEELASRFAGVSPFRV